jgi:hypothetical protein
MYLQTGTVTLGVLRSSGRYNDQIGKFRKKLIILSIRL